MHLGSNRLSPFRVSYLTRKTEEGFGKRRLDWFHEYSEEQHRNRRKREMRIEKNTRYIVSDKCSLTHTRKVGNQGWNVFLQKFWPKLARTFLHEIIATLTLKSVWKFTAVLEFEFHMNRGEFVPVQKKCTSALWGGCVWRIQFVLGRVSVVKPATWLSWRIIKEKKRNNVIHSWSDLRCVKGMSNIK